MVLDDRWVVSKLNRKERSKESQASEVFPLGVKHMRIEFDAKCVTVTNIILFVFLKYLLFEFGKPVRNLRVCGSTSDLGKDLDQFVFCFFNCQAQKCCLFVLNPLYSLRCDDGSGCSLCQPSLAFDPRCLCRVTTLTGGAVVPSVLEVTGILTDTTVQAYFFLHSRPEQSVCVDSGNSPGSEGRNSLAFFGQPRNKVRWWQLAVVCLVSATFSIQLTQFYVPILCY